MPVIKEDRVRFLMPSRVDYQFAAIAVVQTFVNNYQERCKASDVSNGKIAFELSYGLRMVPKDFQFFKDRGLVLNSLPTLHPAEEAGMEVDMTESRVERFYDSGKHLTQVCGLMCGVLCRALPVIRRVKLRTMDWKWFYQPSLACVESLTDNECTGIVATAGPVTYLAASMGLAVIELIANEPNPNWLTKWQNQCYRVVMEKCEGRDDLIARAKISVQKLLSDKVEAMNLCRSEQAAETVLG